MATIDAHAHVSVPSEIWAYKAGLLSHRGAHGNRGPQLSDDDLKAAYYKKEMAPVGHLESMQLNGIDVQLISPRPFQMMNSEKFKLVQWFTEEVNNIIYRDTKLFPGRFYGVCSMPQAAGEPIEKSLPELERCVKELGFVGTLLNPDPYENSGAEAPPLGDRYWYPLYEKLCELDVPAHIHGTSSKSERTPYTLHFINEETIAVYGLVNSNVFKDFPALKIVVSHGGVFARCPSPRTLTDDQLRRIGANGGVVGIGFWQVAVCDSTARGVARSIAYAVKVAGVEHVGLGSDWDGDVREAFGADGLVLLTDALLKEGLSEDDIAKVMGENVIRLLMQGLPPDRSGEKPAAGDSASTTKTAAGPANPTSRASKP